MKRHQQTREQWEQEVRQSQKNITYEDDLRNSERLLRKIGSDGALLSKGLGLVALAVFVTVIVATVLFVVWKSGL